ncbi:hypothetical protein GCM10010954_11550 [Halobacillus andaensis]|uniref:Uncharacterized protein n=1 Tax=Halobacillus andaensis TaxID=1176239 RepID=A0A917B2W2_HALAA|nr:hypothetical protein GCM10010954_11550 [Halobacillus andaensis]
MKDYAGYGDITRKKNLGGDYEVGIDIRTTSSWKDDCGSRIRESYGTKTIS